MIKRETSRVTDRYKNRRAWRSRFLAGKWYAFPSDTSNADKFKNLSSRALFHSFHSHARFACEAPSEKSRASPVFSTAVETGRSAKAGQFVPFKVSATIDYDLDRDLRAWTRAGSTREKLRARARAHVKSILCHTLTRGCSNPNLIYDGTLNDRSLSRGGLCQRADFSDWRVGRFVSLLALKRNRHCAWFLLMRIYTLIRSSIERFVLARKKCIHKIREQSKRSISFARINLWK